MPGTVSDSVNSAVEMAPNPITTELLAAMAEIVAPPLAISLIAKPVSWRPFPTNAVAAIVAPLTMLPAAVTMPFTFTELPALILPDALITPEVRMLPVTLNEFSTPVDVRLEVTMPEFSVVPVSDAAGAVIFAVPAAVNCPWPFTVNVAI